VAVRLKFTFFSGPGAERVGPRLASGEFGDMEQGRLAAMTAAETEHADVDLIDIQAEDGSVSEVWMLRDGKWERDPET
jgi:hypothetical protein